MTSLPSIQLAGNVKLSPTDVRELQLAKGAIAAGLRILTGKLGGSLHSLQTLHLAGAFGNDISQISARRIGLLQVPMDRISAAGNTALHGSRRALFDEPAQWDAIARRVEHLTLNEASSFQALYVEEIPFPVSPF